MGVGPQEHLDIIVDLGSGLKLRVSAWGQTLIID
jgi:hypothetical protein